jgi:hypothetical protein
VANKLGTLRRSAVVSTYGPGAIVDFKADGAAISVVAAGLETWDEYARPARLAGRQTISEPRLERKLGVNGFRLPPVILTDKDESSLIGVRFPEWLQCPNCHMIRPASRWASVIGKVSRYCAECSAERGGRNLVYAVPVRFVAACERGHLEEFPWDAWAGHKAGCGNRWNLYLRAESPGLIGLVLRCPACKSARSMDGIFRKTSFKFPCRGKRPWLGGADEVCPSPLKAMQRGASNLYFPITQSALSIPPWTDTLQLMLGVFWGPLVNTVPEERVARIRWAMESGLLEEMDETPEEIAKAIEHKDTLLAQSSDDLRVDEYDRFISPVEPSKGSLEFELRDEEPKRLTPWFSTLRRAVRLREVRALTGFTRIDPVLPDDAASQLLIAPLAASPISNLRWLPAVDVRGEGIFVKLNSKTLEHWQTNPAVQVRIDMIRTKYAHAFKAKFGTEPERVISAPLILIHTLAHVLMRQLSLECGYSSASLKERLYADEAMHGLLIYTATPDSDGTLGGLSKQGDADLLYDTLRSAIGSVTWCSSDPLCIQGVASMSEATNGAACHACVLAPETSCEEFNGLLDRALLVGLPDCREVGFFSDLAEVF